LLYLGIDYCYRMTLCAAFTTATIVENALLAMAAAIDRDALRLITEPKRPDQMCVHNSAVRWPLKYECDGAGIQTLRVDDQEALTSPETRAHVRKHFESLVNAISGPVPISENVKIEKESPVNSIGALSIPPLIYREYAVELKKLARTATNEPQRALYLKMANVWQRAAIRFEAGLETSDGLSSERGLIEHDRGT